MAFRETEIGEGLQLLVDPVGHLAGDAVPLAHAVVEPAPQPLASVRSTAWTPSPGAAGRPRAAEKPAQSTASCISCSWNSGTPSVLSQRRLHRRMVVGDRLLPVAPLMYGCTEPPWIGPGRISATSTTRS